MATFDTQMTASPVAIASCNQMIRCPGAADTTTRRMHEGIRVVGEEDTGELASMLASMSGNRA